MEYLVPFHQLPPGFPASLDDPPDPPSLARPAATAALLREGPRGGLEVLLLRRSGRVGFIPGAYVFPGGRVDKADEDPALTPFLVGLTPKEANGRLGGPNQAPASAPATAPQPTRALSPPATAFWVAALRETFEEVGVFLAADPPECLTAPPNPGGALAAGRRDLLSGGATFREVLEATGRKLNAGALRYIGHWVTPAAEPRRYDTRFFAAEIRRDSRIHLDRKELVEGLWLTPEEALERNRRGELPMVFPTLKTLEALRPFPSPARALETLSRRKVPRLLPRLVARKEGVGIVL